jgi:putative endonuclease
MLFGKSNKNLSGKDFHVSPERVMYKDVHHKLPRRDCPKIQHCHEISGLGMNNQQTRTEKQIKGDEAEQIAQRYLKKQGLTLIDKNFSARYGEIDLIMEHGTSLVFVEVRYRQSQQYGGAVASVTRSKQRKIINTANFYLQKYKINRPCRFDVIAVEAENQINWIQHAFY